MKTATLDAPARPAVTSTVRALSDRGLLRATSTLVRHERHLQGAVIDHLAEIEARRLFLHRGCSSLFYYAVRELGYSDAAAGRRIGAVRLCADQPDARERLRDGSLTLSTAAELQWAFDRQRRRGSISGTASRAPSGSGPENAVATEDPAADSRAAVSAGSTPFGAAAPNRPAADAAPPRTSAPPASPPLVLDAAGRQRLVEEAAGKSARQVRRMLADLDPELAVPAGEGRRQAGSGVEGAACPETLSRFGGAGHRDPRPHDSGSGVEPGSGAATVTVLCAIAGAGRGVSRRHHSDGEADAATGTELATFAGPAGYGGPPDCCRAETDRRAYSDAEDARFATRDSGGGAAAGLAAGRRPLPLPRPADRTPLQLTTSDRDRPHPALCAWRWCRSREFKAPLPSPSPPSARAA